MMKAATLKREMRRMGVPGLAGIVLLAFSGAFYFSAIQPALQQLDASKKESATWKAHLKKSDNEPRSVETQ